MTKFNETDAGATFIASADSRETSKSVMAAIAFHAQNLAEAEAMWAGDLVNGDSYTQTIIDTATNNHLLDADELFWGGRTLAAVMAE